MNEPAAQLSFRPPVSPTSLSQNHTFLADHCRASANLIVSSSNQREGLIYMLYHIYTVYLNGITNLTNGQSMYKILVYHSAVDDCMV